MTPSGTEDAVREGATDPKTRAKQGRRTPRALIVLIVLVACLIALVVAEGVFSRNSVMTALSSATNAEAVPQVSLVSPEPGPSSRSLDLPGTLAAWYEAPIYGQVSGYIGHWYADYGATVKKGELLATIETPYLDEQLDKAKANLAVAQARLKQANVTAQRWKSLSGTQAVSQQQVDVYASDAEAQKAQVTAEEHNVKRFEAREGFKNLVAPFDGVVTARNTDIGAFVGAGGGDPSGTEPGGQGQPSALFRVADVHKMRIFVSVPQDFATYIKPGDTVTFSLGQGTGKVFKADFLTTAKAVSSVSRTVITELTTDNDDLSLWPGSFATVHFAVPTAPGMLVIPAQAVLFRAEGLTVAVVGSDDKIHLQKVTMGLNLGAKVQITDGLKTTDKIVANPSEGLQEGEQVQVAPAASSGQKEAASAGKAQ